MVELTTGRRILAVAGLEQGQLLKLLVEAGHRRRRERENGCSGRGERSRTDATYLNVPVPLALKIELMGAEQWIGGSIA